MAKPPEYRPDPSDQRRRALVAGIWSKEKHELLTEYVHATRHARGKFHRSTYTELFCGPGRVCYRETGQFADGSALRAWKKSKEGGHPFDALYINDMDRENVEICAARLRDVGAAVTAFNLEASAAAPRILEQLGAGVHLMLLDPFAISQIPFTLVQQFARVDKCDLVVNYGLGDLQRNLPKNLAGTSKVMDAFCPGWRDAVGDTTDPQVQRGRILARWLGLLKGCGIEHSKEMPLVRGADKNAPLYYLVFAAHHEMPRRVWDDLASTGQGDLFDS